MRRNFMRVDFWPRATGRRDIITTTTYFVMLAARRVRGRVSAFAGLNGRVMTVAP